MSIQILNPSRVVEEVSYSYVFKFTDSPGSSFAFPCTEQGEVLPMNPAAAENYRKCLAGEYPVRDVGVEKYVNSYREPAIGKCICGAKVSLGHFTNTCDKCNRDYNSGGQLLAPRSQWGEETGEHLSDILMIP